MDIIQKDKSSKSTVYLPQAPEILATSSTSSVSPQPSSTNSSFSGVQVDNQAAAAEEEVEYKLVIVPVRMKGWFVVHFLDHDVNKISKIEAHYYASLENT
ncbi:hypothetical protein EON65_30425 [archaeon]|nr:MAG: hypothetical protein EON65_30425 [archaeon]